MGPMTRPGTWRRATTRGLVSLLVASFLVVGSGPSTTSASGPTLAQLIGQKLVVRMEGLTPSAALLGLIGGTLLLRRRRNR